jgi:hypothetical protein
MLQLVNPLVERRIEAAPEHPLDPQHQIFAPQIEVDGPCLSAMSTKRHASALMSF